MEATGSLILWDALAGLYDTLGFGAVDDEAFKALVLGRIIEPTSKPTPFGSWANLASTRRHG